MGFEMQYAMPNGALRREWGRHQQPHGGSEVDVVVVHDHQGAREAIAGLLRVAGYRVESFATGYEALR